MGRFPRMRPLARFSKHDRETIDAALDALRLSDLKPGTSRELSGGQQQRAFVARAIAQEPRLLLLDEPTTGVDAATEEALLLIVRSLVEGGLPVLMTTHDLDRAGDWFDRLMVVDRRVLADRGARRSARFRRVCRHSRAHARARAFAQRSPRARLVSDMLLAPFQYEFMQRAFLAALVVGTLCSTIGTYVVLRKLSFIGDGIAHASFAGIVDRVSARHRLLRRRGGRRGHYGARHRLRQPARQRLARYGDRRALHRRVRLRRLPDEPATARTPSICRAFSSATSWRSRAPTSGSILSLSAIVVDLARSCSIGSCSTRRSIRSSRRPSGIKSATASSTPCSCCSRLTIIVSLEAVGIVLVAALLVTPAAAAYQLTREFHAHADALGRDRRGLRGGRPVSSYYLHAASGATIVLLVTLAFFMAMLSKRRWRSAP